MKLLKNTDMNNKKIVNLDSPTLPPRRSDQEVCRWKKYKQSIYSLFR